MNKKIAVIADIAVIARDRKSRISTWRRGGAEKSKIGRSKSIYHRGH
jgi:hypothetical protein